MAHAKAVLNKGVTPAIKKNTLDKQYLFITDVLYTALEELGVSLELSDTQYLFYFYYTYLKPCLMASVDTAKNIKTGGSPPPHANLFTPLNKYLQMSPDISEIAYDVRSLAQLKFYKMLIYKMVDKVNTSLKEAGYKGKLYITKNFYSTLEAYWEVEVKPHIEEEKKLKMEKEAEAEEGEAEEGEVEECEMEEGEVGECESEEGDVEEDQGGV